MYAERALIAEGENVEGLRGCSAACSLAGIRTVLLPDDGFEDIFVTDSDAGRPNHLYDNIGNLAFTDVAEQAGYNITSNAKG